MADAQDTVQQASPLLRTKLHVPPIRRELVSRTRLIERMDQRVLCRVADHAGGHLSPGRRWTVIIRPMMSSTVSNKPHNTAPAWT